MTSTPNHCPGFEQFKHLKSFNCECPVCGAKIEIFSDEFDKPHTCSACGNKVDFKKCTLAGEA